MRQVKELHQGHWELADCERCTCSYKTVGPEPDPQSVHRSYYEQCCWLHLEHVLAINDVVQHMQMTATPPANMLVGPDLGYVVEARVVVGWSAGVDVFVPGLNLLVQVDGEHHQSDAQQDVDIKFMRIAQQQQLHVLRLWHQDMYTMPQDILSMVTACMLHKHDLPTIVKCTKSHPLCSRILYSKLVSPNSM